MRIFLDANILYSAAKTAGAIRRLLSLLTDHGHELVVDGYVVEEARRNLARLEGDANQALLTITATVELVDVQAAPLPADTAPTLHAKDRPVLAGAIRAGCSVLVTGDRVHFGQFFGKTVGGVTIHSPRGLAEELVLHGPAEAPL